MKQFQMGCTMILAAFVLFLSACGEGENEAAKTDTTAAVAPAPESVNTIVTTPENMVMVMHKVADFGKWLAAFEGHDSVRLASGLHKYVIGRGLMDTNMVLIAMKADDIAKARAFSQSPDLKSTMKKAGVTGPPEMNYVVVEWQDTVNVGSIPRVFTSFTVKDKDVWRKAFDEGQQERMNSGIVVRNIGHDADNANNIKLVTALNDTAKAMAYYKSPEMKKRMEAGGIITEPKRFFFTIVKRY
jgi:hypothetical protein